MWPPPPRLCPCRYPNATTSAAQAEAAYAFEQSNSTYDALPSITLPTLVVTGADDLVIPPENAQTLADRLPNAQLYEVRYNGGRLARAAALGRGAGRGGCLGEGVTGRGGERQLVPKPGEERAAAGTGPRSSMHAGVSTPD